MMKGFKGLESFRIMSLVKVGCCKYRDKQITPTDRVSTCNTIDTVSCDCGVVPHRFILRIYWQCVFRSTASPPLGFQMQMGGYGLLGRFCYSPFAFDPIWNPEVFALRWHISDGSHCYKYRQVYQVIESRLNEQTEKSWLLNCWKLSRFECPD